MVRAFAGSRSPRRVDPESLSCAGLVSMRSARFRRNMNFMRPSELTGYANYLKSAVETFSTLTDPWVDSRPDSTAQSELEEARRFVLGDGVWGEAPVREAYAVAASGYSAALDLGRAMTAVLTSGVLTAYPSTTLTRSIVRITSQTWWLLDPDTGVKGRVERLQCLRFRSSLSTQVAARNSAEAEHSNDRSTIGDVYEHSRMLGLDSPRQDGPFYVCGDQRMPPIGRLAVAMLDDLGLGSAYSLGDGFSRGDLIALRQEFEQGRSSHVVQPATDGRMLLNAVTTAVRSLFSAAVRFADLFGLEGSWSIL